MGKNNFEHFDYLLPTDKFYRNSDVIREYGSNYETFIKDSILVKDENLFHKYGSEQLITISTQSGTKTASKHLLLDLLTHEGLYKYLITNLDNELSVGVRFDLFIDGNIKGSIQIGRADLSIFLKRLDQRELNAQQRMRIALITKFTSLFSLTQKYCNYLHTVIIDGNVITIPASILLELLIMPEEQFKQTIASPRYKEYDVAILVYALVNFINVNRILEKYLLPVYALARYNDLEDQRYVDYEALNKNLKANDNDIDGSSIIDKITIDKELEEEIFKYKKNTYSNIELAIYIYIRLCELLTYNQEYYANQSIEREPSIENIRAITLENNAVTSYEFSLLYVYLLKRLGVKYSLDNRILSGDADRRSITFRESEFLVSANAIQSVLKNDMTNAKINAPLVGLKCTNKSNVSRRKFEELHFKIAEELMQTKENQTSFANSLAEYHEKYAIIDLSFKEKLYVLLKDIARPNLKGIDAISYQKRVFERLFKDEDSVKINFISSSINPYRSYTFTPLTIISYKVGEDINYLMIDPNQSDIITPITKEELELLFATKDYAYISKNDPEIIGLELEEGVKYVR